MLVNYKKLAMQALARTQAGRALGSIPFSRVLCKRVILSRNKYPSLFYGVYSSFEAAWQDIPRSRLRGWDHPEAASIWVNHVAPVRPSTYPVFFWLSQLLRQNSTVLDYGGSIGLTYYGYRERASLPVGTRWIVVELPQLVAQGKRTTLAQNVSDLQFTSDLFSVPEADILLSAGALQFMKESVPGLLTKMAASPRFILLNKLPLTDRPAYWTLHNFGRAVTPYHVYNEGEFLRYFEEAGYRERDRWINNDMSCDVPFHPERAVLEFTGLCLERASSATQR